MVFRAERHLALRVVDRSSCQIDHLAACNDNPPDDAVFAKRAQKSVRISVSPCRMIASPHGSRFMKSTIGTVLARGLGETGGVVLANNNNKVALFAVRVRPATEAAQLVQHGGCPKRSPKTQ